MAQPEAEIDEKEYELNNPLNDNGSVMIKHLYNNQQKIKDAQIDILKSLENGLKSTVEKNSETIGDIQENVNDLCGEIKKIKGKDVGEERYKINLYKAISAILAIFTILSMIGVIKWEK